MAEVFWKTQEQIQEEIENRPPTNIEKIAQTQTDIEIENMEQGQKQSDLEIESMRQGQTQTDLELRITALEAK